jgi:hypothetical protein
LFTTHCERWQSWQLPVNASDRVMRVFAEVQIVGLESRNCRLGPPPECRLTPGRHPHRAGFTLAPQDRGQQPTDLVRFHRIGRNRHDLGVIACGAIKCPDIEAGRPPCDVHKGHRCIAFWATLTRYGGDRRAGNRKRLWHQPSNVCAFNQFLFLRSLRSDKAICRCWFRFDPGGSDLA